MLAAQLWFNNLLSAQLLTCLQTSNWWSVYPSNKSQVKWLGTKLIRGTCWYSNTSPFHCCCSQRGQAYASSRIGGKYYMYLIKHLSSEKKNILVADKSDNLVLNVASQIWKLLYRMAWARRKSQRKSIEPLSSFWKKGKTFALALLHNVFRTWFF